MIDTWLIKMPADSKEDTIITTETSSNIGRDATTSYENRMKAYMQGFQRITEDSSKDNIQN